MKQQGTESPQSSGTEGDPDRRARRAVCEDRRLPGGRGNRALETEIKESNLEPEELHKQRQESKIKIMFGEMCHM